MDKACGAEPPDLDTVTALRLGDALWRFLARLNAESDVDEFTWEDAGVNIASGFIEIDSEALLDVQVLLEQLRGPEVSS